MLNQKQRLEQERDTVGTERERERDRKEAKKRQMAQSKQSQVSLIADEKRQSNFSKMKRKMKK